MIPRVLTDEEQVILDKLRRASGLDFENWCSQFSAGLLTTFRCSFGKLEIFAYQRTLPGTDGKLSRWTSSFGIVDRLLNRYCRISIAKDHDIFRSVSLARSLAYKNLDEIISSIKTGNE